MFRVRLLCLMLAVCLILGCGSAMAAEVDCDDVYCLTTQDFFSEEEEPMIGVCITDLPDASTGTVFLGHRVLQPGDILTAEQLAQLTFSPLLTQVDTTAVLTYLPIYENRVAKAATTTFSIRGKEDKAPVAEDSALETYKNLPNEGTLKVHDPEGQTLTYSIIRKPKRGEVELRSDGTFVYTPKKNKVGVDSFTFTAADPAGNVSRTATVTIQILKPSDANKYTDTAGNSCRFTAEWLRNTGLFVGETIGGQSCFQPEKPVSKGEFLAVLVKLLEIPTDAAATQAVPQDTPVWLKPYLAAALRAGLTEDLPEMESAETAVTGAEVAVILQNALDLSISQEALESQTANQDTEEVPAWAAASLLAMKDNGIALEANAALTRGQMSQVLYCVSHLLIHAPGASAWQ